MIRLAIIVVGTLVALATPVQPADAESCGGGSDGGGGSGGGGGGDAGESTPACSETSPVLGHTQCSRYGGWDVSRLPRLRLVIGASAIRRPLPSEPMSLSAEHPDASSRVLVVGDRDRSESWGGVADLALTMALFGPIYGGFEGQLGQLSGHGLRAAGENPAVSVEGTSVVSISAAAVAGVALPLGSLTLRGELATGFDAVGVTVETAAGDCEKSSTTFTSRWSVRPRVRLEHWVTPWITVGAVVDRNVLDDGGASVGLFVGTHLRAFDGAR